MQTQAEQYGCLASCAEAKEGQMTGINSDLAASRGRIADTERQIEALHHRLTRHDPESPEARYAQTALDVLERSLKLMYAQRDRVESDLRRQQKEARRDSKGQRLRASRVRAQFSSESSRADELRLLRDREWQKRAGV